MGKLSTDQIEFFQSQRVPLSDVFDATGMRKVDYAVAMKEVGVNFAFGTTPCGKGGHSLRTRAGHCIQCDTSKIAYQLRHATPGYVYLAGSASTKLLKVGTSIDVGDREKKLSEYAYGGATDWRILASVWVNEAGRTEFAVQDRLRDYATPAQYVRQGRIQGCYELFNCSYERAVEALVLLLPAKSTLDVHDDAKSRAVWASDAL